MKYQFKFTPNWPSVFGYLVGYAIMFAVCGAFMIGAIYSGSMVFAVIMAALNFALAVAFVYHMIGTIVESIGVHEVRGLRDE